MPANSSITLEVLDPTATGIDGLDATLVITTVNDPLVSVRVEATSTAGTLLFDVSATRLVLKYEYVATITVARQVINTTTYLDSNLRKTIRLTDAGSGTDWLAVDLGSWSVPASEATVSVATKKVEVQNTYDAYLNAKAAYEATLANATTIELEQLETYEPASPELIATRMLEFQAGTLEAAIRYATDAQLGTQSDYLNRINKFINLYVSLYPNVSIGDGEGIPYQP